VSTLWGTDHSVEMLGIEAYSFSTGFASRFALTQGSLRQAQPFRFPDAKSAGTLLISTIKKPLRVIFYCGDAGNRTQVQSRFVGRVYSDSRLLSLAALLEKLAKHRAAISRFRNSKVRSLTDLHPSYNAASTVRIPVERRALYARANAKSLSVKYGETEDLAIRVSIRFTS